VTLQRQRQPAGIPAGGQFAPDPRRRTGLVLLTDLTGADTEIAMAKPLDPARAEAGADYAYASLRGEDFTRADLRGAVFASAVLTGARLVDADLSRATLIKAELADVDFTGANLTGADLRDANLPTGLDHADLSRANLPAAVIGPSTGTRFTGACLRGAVLSGRFHDCDFTGVDFTDVWCRGYLHPVMDGRPTAAAVFDNCVFDPGFDPDTVPGANFPDRFNPTLDAAYAAQGFSLKESGQWQACGFTDAAEAADWRQVLAWPDAAEVAKHAGLDPGEARDYRDAGIADWEYAGAWKRAGIDPDLVQPWSAAGFRVDYGTPDAEDAAAWASTRLGPAQAAQWVEAGYSSAQARRYYEAGHTPATAPAPAGRR
jgi:uncharacterized protein YjbI with pentapeptide repeats